MTNTNKPKSRSAAAHRKTSRSSLLKSLASFTAALWKYFGDDVLLKTITQLVIFLLLLILYACLVISTQFVLQLFQLH